MNVFTSKYVSQPVRQNVVSTGAVSDSVDSQKDEKELTLNAYGIVKFTLPDGKILWRAPNGIVVTPVVVAGKMLLADIKDNLVYTLDGFVLEKTSDGNMTQGKSIWSYVPEQQKSMAAPQGSGIKELQTVPSVAPVAKELAADSMASKLPSWAIPAAVGAGGLAIGAGIVYFATRKKSR
jgi:outer membrane protein assembly factor BamB